MPDATTWIIGIRDPMRVSAHSGGGAFDPGLDAPGDATGADVALRPKERAVVAALVADHPRPVSVERITERVWGANPPETALASVRNHVARIRRRLGAESRSEMLSMLRAILAPVGVTQS